MTTRPGVAALPRTLLTLMILLSIGTTRPACAEKAGNTHKTTRGTSITTKIAQNHIERNDKPEMNSLFKGNDSGTLNAKDEKGNDLGVCPLKHTDVSAKISGFVSRVKVKQIFHNPYSKKIEAVYTFPLSHTGAVDDMVLRVGKRTIHATIKRREEARQIYEQARSQGHVASLLEQQRPNIFTQSVANIEPGESIEVTLQYVEMLPFEKGRYTFAFPTVVGPRFNPDNMTASAQEHLQSTGRTQLVTASLPDLIAPRPAIFNSSPLRDQTSAVPDAGRINPPVVPPGYRSGHDVSISVDLDSGVPNRDITSMLHHVDIQPFNEHISRITLSKQDAIPNRDFVLSWNVCDGAIRSGCIPHKEGKSGYFTLVLMPPNRVETADVVPKEMIFVIDTSGSQSGEPIDKAKETMSYILDHMNPQDTFQVMSFSNETKTLFDKPKRASAMMKLSAHRYINAMEANGGTYMGPAIEKVCSMPAEPGRLRIVTFMTDGYVGNDMEVLGLVRKLRGSSRWFSFGTGDSVNRFLIDGIAREGGGEAEYVLLNRPGAEVAKRFYERISTPVLANVKVDIEGVDAKDIFPREISDVWAQKPLYVFGRYGRAGSSKVRLSGFAGGKPYKQEMNIEFPDRLPTNSGVPSMWARNAVEALMAEDWFRTQLQRPDPAIEKAIVEIALAHHIMTQYTSFVAVDTESVTSGSSPVTVDVPVELPEGVSYEALFGKGSAIPPTPNVVENASPAPATELSTNIPNNLISWIPMGPGSPSSIVNWLTASSRDANLFDGGDVSTMPLSLIPTRTHSATTQNIAMPSTSTTASQAYESQAPTLQGATNGMIGPQGTDATYIAGINTSGTVRVNNLAKLEVLLNLTCIVLELTILLVGAIATISGVARLKKNHRAGLNSIAWGVIWLTLGWLCSPLLIPMVVISGLHRLAKRKR